MKWAVITLNKQSISQAKKLNDKFDIDIYTMEQYLEEGIKPLTGGLKNSMEELVNNYNVIIFVMAIGIIIRNIEPYIKHKSIDPAVLCLSVDGKFIIPVLSGHLGGANEVAYKISENLPITPVITTASDLLGKKAVDMIAKANNLVISSFKDALKITTQIINNEKVDIVSEVKINIDNVIDYDVYEPNNPSGIILISFRNNICFNFPTVQLIPKKLVVGVGCRKDILFEKLYNFLEQVLTENNLDIRGLKSLSSINIKKDEKAILELSKKLNIPFITYTPEELNKVVEPFEQSTFVKKITGVGAVSMPSGYLGSSKGRCLVKKQKLEGITISIWEEI